MRFVVLSALIICLAACTSSEQREQLSRVNDLKQALDSVEVLYHTQDSATLASLFSRAQHNSEMLDKVPDEDQDQQLIAANRNSERVYRRFLANTERMMDELEYSYQQLEDMENDIRGGHIDPQVFPYMFKEEEKAVKNLLHTLRYIVEEIEKEKKRADSLQREIKDHLDQFDLFL